ncbi:MAG: T9SS type A sorting domain-containing protein [Bacteroidetes bacterium]|nr:T9SS type A sorting domain-containing protein [Bacteroidota bacterium]
MQKPWIFTSNTFEVNTQGSHKKMLALAADTEAKLKTEANDLAINALYQAYFPVYNITGKIVLHHGLTNTNNVYIINTQNLTPGLYLIGVFADGKMVEQQKFVKE